ncbi:uncharacterized protein MONBRDRAFT_33408 [Monosiga brevicollis MX1]|uniref:Uncharacterized protein n=1 Tax=Monosiga brevicollis TaxID=81824 RepID=A9V586_MONBE|nr:uncharacterized protein MONBRDRAFT_33408 [Monosiga brevicollis MX1]EDQ87232.1 predicted protein [Monosiga brevicollis MX1]|eukprot:XP_001747845.1 hypothetical protein [Monosiga brevicollis MX1]
MAAPETILPQAGLGQAVVIARPYSSNQLPGPAKHIELGNFGRLAALAFEVGPPLFVDMASKDVLHRLPNCHAADNTRVRVTADGLISLSCDQNGDACVVYVPTPELLGHITLAPGCCAFAMTKSGEFAWAIDHQAHLHAWHLPTFAKIASVPMDPHGQFGTVVDVACAESHSTLLVAWTQAVELFSLASATDLTKRVSLTATHAITSALAINTNNTLFAFGDAHARIALHTIADGALLKIFQHFDSSRPIIALDLNATGSKAVYAIEQDPSFYLASITSSSLLAAYHHLSKPVNDVKFLHTIDCIMSVGQDGFLKTWPADVSGYVRATPGRTHVPAQPQAPVEELPVATELPEHMPAHAASANKPQAPIASNDVPPLLARPRFLASGPNPNQEDNLPDLF